MNPTSNSQPDKIHLYLGNDDHTDYMWTADADTYNSVFVEMLDHYLELADQTENHPSPYRSRFNADGSYWLWQYERQKTPAEFHRLIERVRDGHISAPLNTLVSCYGGQPMEAVLRGMYYAGRLERRFGLRFPVAIAMENQTLPFGLASLWAGSGAKYSWKGVCACASRMPMASFSHRDHEMYWFTGPDGQRVLMKWYSVSPKPIGTYLEAWDPVFAIHYMDSDVEFLKRCANKKTGEPYSVRAAFGFGGDCLDRKTGVPAHPGPPKIPGQTQAVPGYPETEHFFVTAARESTDSRQVFVSNTTDFFEDFEEKYGADLPSEGVTYGNEWDLYSASMAETSARVRRAVEKLRSAELMSSLVGLKFPSFMNSRVKSRDQAFTDLGLYWEHDWTADGPVSRSHRAAWQELLASEIEYYVNPLHADSAAIMGFLIRQPVGAGKRFYVLNPLGSVRTDFADFAYEGPSDIRVQEVVNGALVPHQVVSLGGKTYLRILASDVPSTGYKTYEVVKSFHGTSETSLAANAEHLPSGRISLENNMVKVVVSPGGVIENFLDKRNGNSELATHLNKIEPPDPTDHIQLESLGPVSATLRCESRAGLARTTWITVFRNSDRVEICNRIDANFGDVRHWSFAFNLSDPKIHTEEIGAVIQDRLKSQGGDYADAHARYDYVTLNHFADITDGSGNRGVTLSNSDCSFAKIGDSTPQHLDSSSSEIHVLAGGQVDGRSLGIQDQNGAREFTQRFALKPHRTYDPASAMRFSLEHQNPFVTGEINGNASAPYPADVYSLLSLDDPGVMLWALKPAEEGMQVGLIARFWRLAGESREVRLTMSIDLTEAKHTTHLETDLDSIPIENSVLAGGLRFGGTVKLNLSPSQIKTLRLIPSQEAPQS